MVHLNLKAPEEPTSSHPALSHLKEPYPVSTPAQLEANRENATHSTGPITGEGKAASSLNHLQHGLSGGVFRILPHENSETYASLLTGFREDHQFTASTTENVLIERMAQHQWLSQRAQFLQSSLFFERHLTSDEQKFLALYFRYQSTHDRAFFKCLHELARLKSERRQQEIGFKREKRSAAEEVRKQESHQVRTRTAIARARNLEVDAALNQRAAACVTAFKTVAVSSAMIAEAESAASNLIESLAVEADAPTDLVSTVRAI